jgi:uncharacterized glyoxalase superfamily protein PhnB
MPEHDGHHYPTVCTYLFYEDGAAALDFLTNAFGLKERMRSLQPDGSVGDGVVMVGCPPNQRTPSELGHITAGVYVLVDDVDAHFACARAAGANVQGEPTDMPYGVRSYGALDCEGHQWWFSQVIA